MLKEKCFELDSKAILADDNFSENYYIEYGNNLLSLFENEQLLKTVLDPLERKVTLEGKWGLSRNVDNKLKKLGFDLGWMPVFYGEGKGWLSFVAGVTFFEEKFGLLIPLVFYNNHPLSQLNFTTSQSTCLHELIHAARANIQDKKYAMGSAFDENIANYFSLNFDHSSHSPLNMLKLKLNTRLVKLMLEDLVGDKAGYVIGRLKEKEFYEIKEKKSLLGVRNYLEEKKDLRFQIIKEKLGF